MEVAAEAVVQQHAVTSKPMVLLSRQTWPTSSSPNRFAIFRLSAPSLLPFHPFQLLNTLFSYPQPYLQSRAPFITAGKRRLVMSNLSVSAVARKDPSDVL